MHDERSSELAMVRAAEATAQQALAEARDACATEAAEAAVAVAAARIDAERREAVLSQALADAAALHEALEETRAAEAGARATLAAVRTDAAERLRTVREEADAAAVRAARTAAEVGYCERTTVQRGDGEGSVANNAHQIIILRKQEAQLLWEDVSGSPHHWPLPTDPVSPRIGAMGQSR